MSSPAIYTMIKMLQALPESMQDQVMEHLKKYIAELLDESRWDESFRRTQRQLIDAANQAQAEVEAGKSEEMDFKRL